MANTDPGGSRGQRDRLRVGVVGTGGMGSFHARTLAALHGVDLALVSDPVHANAAPLIAEFGCQYEPDPLVAALDDGLDGVVIASPDDTHAELALAAAGVGTWVLCEKPLATTGIDARRVVDASPGLNGPIQLGYMREFDPAHVQLANELGSIGDIVHLRLVHRNANETPPPVHRAVTQSMVHDIHSVRFLSRREIVRVSAYCSSAVGHGYRHLLAVCELSDGAHATIEFDGAGFAYEVSVEVLGSRGGVVTGSPTRAVVRRDGYSGSNIGADWFGRFATAYQLQDEAWVRSIRAGTPIGPTVQDGLAAQLVADAILASVESQAPVAVEGMAPLRGGDEPR